MAMLHQNREIIESPFTAFCKNTGHGANAANKNMVTPPKLGGNTIP